MTTPNEEPGKLINHSLKNYRLHSEWPESSDELEIELKRAYEHVAHLDREIDRADNFDEVKSLQHRHDIAKAYASGLQRAQHHSAALIAKHTLEARIGEQERTGLTKISKDSGQIVYFQEDGSTFITQEHRIAQLKKGHSNDERN